MSSRAAAWKGLFLAVASGLALGATFSPHGGPVLPFVAFAPLGMVLARTSRDAAVRPLSPFHPGFAAAVVAHGIGLHWMVPALAWRSSLAVPIYLLVLVLIGLVAGAATGAASFLHRRKGWPLPIALAACWVGFEWMAARVPGVPYAWLNAGSSLAWTPALAAGSEVFGARFLSFWTVASGTWLGVVVASRPLRPARPLRLALLTPLVLAVPVAAGFLRQATLEESGVAARVAVVQPGSGEGRLDRWLSPLRQLRSTDPFDMAVFPERFLAAPLRRSGEPTATEAGESVAAFAEALGVPVVIGALDTAVPESGGDTLWYNAAFLQQPGEPLSPAYRKSRLVPGLEGTGGWPGAAFDLPGGYAAGRNPQPLATSDSRVGALICYDSAYGETARRLALAGADWLVVLSNDDWLDPARPFRTTWAYWQHATHGRLRAIENRMSLVQAGATGYSFAVSPAGGGDRVALEPGVEGVAVLTVGRRRRSTLFTRMGDILGLACFAVLAVAAAAGSTSRFSARPFADRHDRLRSATLKG